MRKQDKAFEIFKAHLPKRTEMSKKDFRALVVEDMSKQLDVTSKGTLGMYFAWSDREVTGRATKQYLRVDGHNKTKEEILENAAPKTDEQKIVIAQNEAALKAENNRILDTAHRNAMKFIHDKKRRLVQQAAKRAS